MRDVLGSGDTGKDPSALIPGRAVSWAFWEAFVALSGAISVPAGACTVGSAVISAGMQHSGRRQLLKGG